MAKRSAIVVGATGLTGHSLVQQLCESDDYIAVSVISRREIGYNHPKLEVKIRNFDKLEEGDLDIADDLFICLGTTMKKAKTKANFRKVDLYYPLQIASLAKKRGIHHILVISAMGTNKKSPFFYSKVKGELEEQLMDLNLPKLSIFRPSLLTGKRGEFRLGERMAEGFFHLVNPLLIGPFKRFRSIEASQLAYAMYHFALRGNKNKVNVYKPLQILDAKFVEEVEEPPLNREDVFNWDKRDGIFIEEKKIKE